MGASATLETGHLGGPPPAGDPGGRASVILRVRNNGAVADELLLEPIGAMAPWMVVEPPSLMLPPGAEAAVTISFVPPRSASVIPGETPFGVQVSSRQDPDDSVAAQGVIVVGRYDERVITT